jgi:glutamine synthetase
MTDETRPSSASFGENTFSFHVMRERLPKEFFDKLMFSIRNHRPISPDTADVIAHAMKEWALTRGATHYTHWFQPLTGLTAEKHDSFLAFDDTGRPIERFSGRQLIMSEPDASSFPHGGLRSTFEARGYAAWDPSSPAFLMKRAGSATLCLPSIFVSYKGEVLDKKTPLIRSVAAVSKASVRMLRVLGNKRVTFVTPNVGAEQEYFLVDAALFERRPDLCEVGHTLFGARPARGQQLDDHYFRAINDRVLALMEHVEQELIRLGVPAKTRHNEVAPGQFELACLHQPANIAADQNQLVMEVLRRLAPMHGMQALLHEKPFAGINGSGKHNNWSLIDSEGLNLYEPGSSYPAHVRFLIFLMAVVLGAHRHGRLLRGIVASPANDLRLGGNEAPPSIISVYLGDHLTSLLEGLAEKRPEAHASLEEIDLGTGGVARIPRDTTDRNRTSPFAFTGNKFEFRAVGASAAISLTNAVINTMVAEALDTMADRIEARMGKGEERLAAAVEVLREVIAESRPVRFDGDNYSEEWLREARRLKLGMASTTPEALEALSEESSLALFERYGVLTREELTARKRIRLDLYVKTVAVELKVARRMLSVRVLPDALRSQERIARSINETARALPEAGAGLDAERRRLARLTDLIGGLLANLATLEADEGALAANGELADHARRCAEEVRPHIAAARTVSDAIEELVDARDWTLPRYDELLSISRG